MRRVENKDRKFGSAKSYWHTNIAGEDYLFTDNELETAQKRAIDNPEDIVEEINILTTKNTVTVVLIIAVSIISLLALWQGVASYAVVIATILEVAGILWLKNGWEKSEQALEGFKARMNKE